MKELEDFIAQKLLNLKAVKLQARNPFEWNTGWLSPMYFDSRKILSYKVRNVIKVDKDPVKTLMALDASDNLRKLY